MKNKSSILFSLLLLLFFVQCNNDTTECCLPSELTASTETENNLPKVLVSSSQSANFGASSLKVLLNFANIDHSAYSLKDVVSHKIIYSTQNTNGETIQASGIVFMPNDVATQEYSIISLQHGTITNKDDAPSNANIIDSETAVAVYMASIGFIVAMPDYIGYGISKDLEHPYEVAENLGSTSYDMLLATNNFLKSEEINSSTKLFLAGYSEGGDATMALHQKIQAENIMEVTYSSPGAGPYNKTEFLKEIARRDSEMPFITYYLWILDVYNSLYPELQNEWAYYLNEPYAGYINSIQPFSITEIDETKITLNPRELFKDSFRTEVLDNPLSAINLAVNQNNTYDWLPLAPITLYQGTEDNFVLPLNATTTQEIISQNGGTINYIPIEGADHFMAALPYFTQTINQIYTLDRSTK